MTTLTLTGGQISPIIEIGKGTRVTSSGNGTIEYYPGALADAKNGGTFETWPKGTAAGSVDAIRGMCIRATATGAMVVTLEEGRNDFYADGAYWDSEYATLSTDANNNTVLVGADGAYQLGNGITEDGIVRMSAVGDSISNRDSAISWVATGQNGPLASGMIFCTQMISNGAVELVGAYAVAGYTTTQIAGTSQANGLTLVQAAIADSSRVVAVLAGTNDTYGMPTPDDANVIFARITDDIWAPIMRAGKKVLAHTIPPQSPATPSTSIQRAAVAQVNKLIRDYCHANKIMLVDLAAMWRSADGANQGARTALLLNESSSYIHPNESGGMVAALERWRVLQAAGMDVKPTEGIGLSSPYSIGANPHGVGSNATTVNRSVIGTGIAGTVPHGWNVLRTGTSTATVSPAAVARADNRDGQSVQIEVAIVGAGEQIKVFPQYNGSLYVLTSSPSATKELRGSSTLYAPGQCKKFSNGLWYKTLVLGTTAASEPGSLPTSIGGIIADGTQTWIKIPELTPGTAWVRTVAEVVVTAHAVENFNAYVHLRQYTEAFASLAAGVVFDDNEGTTLTAGPSGTASSFGVVQGGAQPGNHGYAVGILPLNKRLYIKTPWVKVAADCGIIEPCLVLTGKAGATATVLVNHLDMQVRG